MIYELLEGYSNGFIYGMKGDELNEVLSEQGVTIVYKPDFTRHVFIDDSVSPEYTEDCLRSMKYKPVEEVDWKYFYLHGEIIGHGAVHPYFDMEKWKQEKRKRRG